MALAGKKKMNVRLVTVMVMLAVVSEVRLAWVTVLVWEMVLVEETVWTTVLVIVVETKKASL